MTSKDWGGVKPIWLKFARHHDCLTIDCECGHASGDNWQDDCTCYQDAVIAAEHGRSERAAGKEEGIQEGRAAVRKLAADMDDAPKRMADVANMLITKQSSHHECANFLLNSAARYTRVLSESRAQREDNANG